MQGKQLLLEILREGKLENKTLSKMNNINFDDKVEVDTALKSLLQTDYNQQIESYFKSFQKDIICWWSGGITSAVACKIAIDTYGKENCRVIFIDTRNEDDDTYRFLKECSDWYGLPIETITNENYKNIQEVWYRFKSLNVANGAVCSSQLKKEVREKWQRSNTWKHQVFGFDLDEIKRVKSMTMNNPHVKAIYPLLLHGISKKECIKIVQEANLTVPNMYSLGYSNNNCFKTGCVQGGIGYWQKIAREFPDKLEAMAKVEHELTAMKGKPVTMLRESAKKSNGGVRFPIFLKYNPDYPEIKTLNDVKGREPKSMVDCNGFCGINDLTSKNELEENEINYEQESDEDLLQRLMGNIEK